MSCRLDSCKLAYAAVDWLSCTSTTPDASHSLWNLALRLQPQRLPESEQPTRWHAHGYDGWSLTGLAVGARVDGVLLRLSGEQSANNWREAVSTADNVTRLDLAVDFESENPVTGVALDVYRQTSHRRSRTGRPATRSVHISSDGGQTAYVGSRASEQMGRVYDKGVEQRTHAPGLKWRFELELKKESALAAAKALVAAVDDRAELITTTLGWFRARGVRIPKVWPSFEVRNLKLAVPRPDRRIEWVARCVRPTVLDLTDTLGRERMLGVLGLHVPTSYSC